MGRPPSYTPELAIAICERLANGESLKAICSSDDMPHRATVHRWIIDNVDGFSDRYAHARDVGLDTMADELLDISDDGRNDWMEKNDPDNPGYVFNGEHSSRSKLRVDARKWYLSKLAPKKYGEKSSMELTGANGGPVLLSETERAAKLSAILATAKARKDDDVSDLV